MLFSFEKTIFVFFLFCRFRSYYGLDIGKKTQGEGEEKPPSKHTLYAQEQRRNKGTPKVDPLLEEQFNTGRLLACISSRPGQVGRADGYILEVSIFFFILIVIFIFYIFEYLSRL